MVKIGSVNPAEPNWPATCGRSDVNNFIPTDPSQKLFIPLRFRIVAQAACAEHVRNPQDIVDKKCVL